MPYIKRAEALLIDAASKNITTSGHRNYRITQLIIDRWLQDPSYRTSEEIFNEFFEHPEENADLIALTRGSPFPRSQWYTSSRKAVIEFERRVVSRYEEFKKKQKDAVDPYAERNVLWANEGLTAFKEKSHG